jgi:hypothetical protein
MWLRGMRTLNCTHCGKRVFRIRLLLIVDCQSLAYVLLLQYVSVVIPVRYSIGLPEDQPYLWVVEESH